MVPSGIQQEYPWYPVMVPLGIQQEYPKYSVMVPKVSNDGTFWYPTRVPIIWYPERVPTGIQQEYHLSGIQMKNTQAYLS